MHVSSLMNIHNIYDYVTGDMNIHCNMVCLNIHEYVTGDMAIHEHMWRMTEYSWAHVTDDWI